MRKIFFIVVSMILILSIGCVSRTQLNSSPPENTGSQYRPDKAREGDKFIVPCVLYINASQDLNGEEESITRELGFSKQYSYALKSILERAFQDVLFERFAPAEGNYAYALTLNVDAPLSQLKIDSNAAQYQIKCRAELRSPEGILVYSEILDRKQSSPFDGKNTPSAVWASVYEVASEHVKRMTQLPATIQMVKQLEKKIERDKDIERIECILRMYDQSGNLETSEEKGITTISEKEAEARNLVKKLVNSLKGEEPYRIAIIDFHPNQDAKDRNIDQELCETVKDTLKNDPRVNVISKNDLEKILVKYNITVEDVTNNPGLLKERNIKLESVSFILIGQIDVLMKK